VSKVVLLNAHLTSILPICSYIVWCRRRGLAILVCATIAAVVSGIGAEALLVSAACSRFTAVYKLRSGCWQQDISTSVNICIRSWRWRRS
jgi:hypothetical protein